MAWADIQATVRDAIRGHFRKIVDPECPNFRADGDGVQSDLRGKSLLNRNEFSRIDHRPGWRAGR